MTVICKKTPKNKRENSIVRTFQRSHCTIKIILIFSAEASTESFQPNSTLTVSYLTWHTLCTLCAWVWHVKINNNY